MRLCFDNSMICYIAIGSNLADSVALNRQALDDMAGLAQTSLLRASSLYRSDPVGPQDQPCFINSVAEIATRLEPLMLLQSLQAIEQQHGRIRGRRWGPRTLDLDILLAGEQVIEHARLSVPHPHMASRAFVLLPLYEVAPELQIPGFGKLSGMLDAVAHQAVCKLPDSEMITVQK